MQWNLVWFALKGTLGAVKGICSSCLHWNARCFQLASLVVLSDKRRIAKWLIWFTSPVSGVHVCVYVPSHQFCHHDLRWMSVSGKNTWSLIQWRLAELVILYVQMQDVKPLSKLNVLSKYFLWWSIPSATVCHLFLAVCLCVVVMFICVVILLSKVPYGHTCRFKASRTPFMSFKSEPRQFCVTANTTKNFHS